MQIFYFKKFFIVFIIGLSFIISSCSEDSSLTGDGNVKNKPTNILVKKEIDTSINGVLVDGYIKNATVCVDSNDDGICLGELQTKTNDKGEFSLTFSAKKGTFHTIIGTGGIDTATNKRFNGTYKNIIEAKDDIKRFVWPLNITPITTIMTHIYTVQVRANPNYSIKSATDKVASSLGLSRNQISTDPLKNKEVFKKTQQVVQTIAILGSTMQADETNANTKKSFDFVMDKLSTSINTGKHEGGLDVDKVVSTLNKSTYEGKEVTISTNIVSLAKDNVNNISDKVAASDGTDLTTIQVETQQTTDTITTSVVTAKIEAVDNTPPPSKPADSSNPVFISSNAPIKVYEGKTSVITVQATDDSAITYSVGGSDGSSFNIGSSGAITFKTAPSYSEQTTYSFMAIATDATGNKATQNLTVNILAVDSVKPVFTSPNTKSVKENQTGIMDLKATDANTITYSIGGADADKFNLDNSSGKITFKEAPDYEVDSKIYSITATAKDESENSATQSITINVIDVDEIDPVFTSSNEKNVSENQTDAITLQVDDASNITLSISGDDSDKFNIDNSSKKITFKVAPDYETKTSYSFTVEAEDTEGNKATQNITINIEDIDENVEDNDAPVFKSPNTIDVNENETDVIALKTEDINAVTYKISEDENNSFNIDSASGVVTFKVAPDFESGKTAYTFKATATDAKNNIANQTITVTIKDVDEIYPVFTSKDKTDINASKDKTDAITLVATDTSTITYGLSGSDSDKFNIDSSSGIITFKEAPSYEDKSSYTFVATATDEAENETTQNITLTILYVDIKAPVFTSSNKADIDENENEDNITAITLVATDDNTTIYSISGTDSGSFEVNSSTGVVTINKPDYETKKSYTFIATAKDDFDNSANKKITINIKDINDEKPIFTSDAKYETPENVDYTFTIVATDADYNTTIQYAITGGTAIVNQSGVVSFTGDLDYETETNITLVATASDGVHTISQTIELKITDVDDDLPEFTSKTDFNVTETSSAKTAFTVVATDASTPITYGMDGADSSSFEIDSTSGVVTFKEFPDYETKTSYSFIVTAEDNLKNQATQNIKINIEDINDEKPVFTSKNNYSTKENAEYSFTLKATDKDANSVIEYSITGSGKASIVKDTGVVTLTNEIDFETDGNITLTATAKDGINETNQEINITLINIDEEAPVFTSKDAVDVNETKKKVVKLTATDDSDITYSISGSDDKDSFEIGQDDWLSFKEMPDYETKTAYVVDINATDELGNTAKQTINITILDVDEDAPVFTSDDNVSVDENQKSAITLVATDDDNITYSISGGDSASFDVNSSNGIVTFKLTSLPDYETKTSYTFEAKATDTGGKAGVQDVKINIKNLNDNAPIFISKSNQVSFIKSVNAMTLVAKDADGDTVTYAISDGNSSKFDLNPTSGKITFKVIPERYETHSFTATASSLGGNEATQTVQLTVQDSIFTSICDEDQTYIKFFGSNVAESKFENIWTEGTKGVENTNIIHFDKIDGIKSYDLEIEIEGNHPSTIPTIFRTTSITRIQFARNKDNDEGIGVFDLTDGLIGLISKHFTLGTKIGIKLIAKNASQTIDSGQIWLTIGEEYHLLKAPLGLHFKSATANSVNLGWCETGASKYQINSHDTSDTTVKEKNVSDSNGTVITVSNTLHSFAVAGIEENNKTGAFSRTMDITPTDITNAINFKIEKVTFNQAVQVDMKDGNSSPIIAGKPGVLRVFVEMESNLPSHKVKVKLTGTDEANESLPSIIKEVLLKNSKFDEADSTTKPVAFLLDNERWLKVGNKFAVEVDYDDNITESDETDNRYPVESEGNKSFNFENAHGMLVHFIPVHVNGKSDPAINQALVDSTKDYLQDMYPLSNVSIVLETPMENYSYPADNFTNVQGLLDALNTRGKNKVNTEGMPIWTFYMGIIHPDVTALFNGIAESLSFRGLKYHYRTRFLASLAEAPTDTNGYDFFYKTVAHEIAHSHDIKHVKTPLVDGFCYDVGSSNFYGVGRDSDDGDVDFPYSEGKIGRTGYRQSIKSLYDKTKMYDIMSYCRTTWISDFIYNRIYAYEKELTRVYDDRTITISRSIRSLEPLVEGRLISGRIIHNNWKLTNTVLVKRRDIISKAKEDFSLKVELVNGDIFEVPVELINLSSTSMKTFRVFIPSTKDIKVIQVVNRHNKDVITLDFK